MTGKEKVKGITRKEFEILMDCLGILICDNERRLKGFIIEWRPPVIEWIPPGYVVIIGKIPLPLANAISSDSKRNLEIYVEGDAEDTLPIQYAKHSSLEEYYEKLDVKNFHKKRDQLIKDGRENEMYIEKYHVYTIEGLKHVINCINEWAIVNKDI